MRYSVVCGAFSVQEPQFRVVAQRPEAIAQYVRYLLRSGGFHLCDDLNDLHACAVLFAQLLRALRRHPCGTAHIAIISRPSMGFGAPYLRTDPRIGANAEYAEVRAAMEL